MKKFTLILILFVFIGACGNEPATYEDCILEKVKEGMNRSAINLVVAACREKFKAPTIKPVERELTLDERTKLTGTANYDYGSYRGKIYNGNDSLTLKEIEVQLTIERGDEKITRQYIDNVSIKPFTIGEFSFEIISGSRYDNYSWSISNAKGIPAE